MVTTEYRLFEGKRNFAPLRRYSVKRAREAVRTDSYSLSPSIAKLTVHGNEDIQLSVHEKPSGQTVTADVSIGSKATEYGLPHRLERTQLSVQEKPSWQSVAADVSIGSKATEYGLPHRLERTQLSVQEKPSWQSVAADVSIGSKATEYGLPHRLERTQLSVQEKPSWQSVAADVSIGSKATEYGLPHRLEGTQLSVQEKPSWQSVAADFSIGIRIIAPLRRYSVKRAREAVRTDSYSLSPSIAKLTVHGNEDIQLSVHEKPSGQTVTADVSIYSEAHSPSVSEGFIVLDILQN
ncbi:hypothetical protein J6590_081780 [Homalodisca vitripennis]|nr:hypothetical protein J6590_081780 [Homalodisca vitripennis]